MSISTYTLLQFTVLSTLLMLPWWCWRKWSIHVGNL